jgi:hypothetical protein
MFFHSYCSCFYIRVVYTCVHHKEAHHISLYKDYDKICCDTVSKHVSDVQAYEQVTDICVCASL